MRGIYVACLRTPPTAPPPTLAVLQAAAAVPLVVRKRMKRSGRISSGMPGPVSVTRRTGRLPSSRKESRPTVEKSWLTAEKVAAYYRVSPPPSRSPA